MKVSARARYALLAVLQLSAERTRGEKVVQIHTIADKQKIPARYLVQILLQLNRAGIVNSVRGAKGGYTLARDPSEIHVGDIIRAIEGPIQPAMCISGDSPEVCALDHPCPFKRVWDNVTGAVSEVLDKADFATLSHEFSGGENMYYI